MNLWPYFSGAYTPVFAFLRQDYSLKDYQSSVMNIYKNGALVTSSTLPQFAAKSIMWSSSPLILSLALPGSGTYTMKLAMPYADKGISMTGNVTAMFNTSLADPNPPAFKRMYYFANNSRSEVYDPAVPNRVEFELDPVGGTMATVSANYSASASTMQPTPVTLTNGVYTANIPSVPALTKMTIQIIGTDSSGNSLSYSFELPVGTAPPPPNGTPTPTPTPTPAVKPGDANGDGLVNEADYTIWASHYLQQLTGGATVGDFSGDGVVNGVDYVLWLNNRTP